MKAQNLTISVPNKGCDKNCPYCISRMTNPKISNFQIMMKNVEKVIHIASLAGVESVLFTGKGEPTLNFDDLWMLSHYFSDWPLELQTNGIRLSSDKKLLQRFAERFNVISVSMDCDEQFESQKMKEMFVLINELGMVPRITINITSLLKYYCNFERLLTYCIENSIKQLTLRKIVVPLDYHNQKVNDWIMDNVSENKYAQLLSEGIGYAIDKGRLIKELNYGVKIYDCNGIAFCHSDYCIQENSHETDTRSLIFQEDGHLYTHWNSDASILF